MESSIIVMMQNMKIGVPLLNLLVIDAESMNQGWIDLSPQFDHQFEDERM
jgi:hypothetical protein